MYYDEYGTPVYTDEEWAAQVPRGLEPQPVEEPPTLYVAPPISKRARDFIELSNERLASGETGDGGEEGALAAIRRRFAAQDAGELDIKQAGFGGAELIQWLPLIASLIGGFAGGGVGGAIRAGGTALVSKAGGSGVAMGSPIPGIPLVGPGVPEPPAAYVKRRWETRVYDNELGYIKLNFYALTDGRIAMYHNYRKYWKVWRPKKNIVIGSKMNLLSTIKAARKIDRVFSQVEKRIKRSKIKRAKAV